jgi:hypothetical protein
MQRDEIRTVVAQQFQQSLAESGVQITALPPAQLNALVNALADGIFAAIDALEDEGNQVVSPPTPRAIDHEDAPGAMGNTGGNTGSNTVNNVNNTVGRASGSDEEVLLWRGRPYLSIGTRYELTTQRLRIYRGILSNNFDEIELVRVKDSKVKQHMGERMLDVGDITIISADSSTPEFILHNVRNPLDVRELLRKAVKDEKARRGVFFREDIGGPTA